jgi:hypothetical protein
MWFLEQEPLSSYFGAFDSFSQMWIQECGFKHIVAGLKEVTALVRQGHISNYMTRR